MHERNSFLTLTYSTANLPLDGSVTVRDVQLFLKRLRKALYPERVRFFACGEYGERTGRPHYHMVLFGEDFTTDRVLHRKNDRGDLLYTSSTLTNLWNLGHATLGDVTYQSASYTARYSLKKITGKGAPVAYVRRHPAHGFFCRVRPEFAIMSRRPGIGSTWFDRYASDVFPSDQVVVNGSARSAPRYYVQKLPQAEQEALSRIRRRKALPTKSERTNRRRYVRATVRDARISKLQRNLKDDDQ